MKTELMIFLALLVSGCLTSGNNEVTVKGLPDGIYFTKYEYDAGIGIVLSKEELRLSSGFYENRRYSFKKIDSSTYSKVFDLLRVVGRIEIIGDSIKYILDSSGSYCCEEMDSINVSGVPMEKIVGANSIKFQIKEISDSGFVVVHPDNNPELRNWVYSKKK
jgi:hypothetical protein